MQQGDWHAFPLTLFLERIRGDFPLGIGDYERMLRVLQAGDAWTITRLKHVLCALIARSPEQVERFHRLFNDFFAGSGEPIPAETVAVWIQAIRAEAAEPEAPTSSVSVSARPGQSNHGQAVTDTDEHRRRNPWGLLVVLVLMEVLVLLVVYWLWPVPPEPQPQNQPPPPSVVAPDPVTTTPAPSPPAAQAMRLYRDVPVIQSITREPLPRPPALWPWLAGLAGIMLLLSLGFALHLRRLQRPPPDKAPMVDSGAPVHFARGSIGGNKLPARIAPTEMTAMADAMGYFTSDQPDRRLDIDASIHATLKQGGIADCRFLRRQRIRTLLILQDERAGALGWNGIAAELAQGMERHGVPVTFGRYRGDPAQFISSKGESLHLEDLEDQRQGLLVLLFCDGTSFHRHPVQRTLKQLQQWPMVAWLDLRLPQFQYEGTALARRLGLPRFDATASGILAALGRFLAESGADQQRKTVAVPPPGRNGFTLERWLEMQLGSALMWLADCSKLQPITPALAQQLRETFHPHLPVEQIECLHRLPGSTASPVGIQFSHEVRCALGRLWLRRHDAQRQRELLQWLLAALEQAKPQASAESLAMLNWEMLRERLLLELDAEGEHRRLGELLHSPLADALSDSLRDYAMPANDGSVPEGKIPLAIRLRNPKALLRLRGMADNPLGIGLLVKPWHKMTMSALASVTLLLCAGALFPRSHAPAWERIPALLFSNRACGGGFGRGVR